jgi:hypothetical protein
MLQVGATGIEEEEEEEEEEDPVSPNPKITSIFVHHAQTFREISNATFMMMIIVLLPTRPGESQVTLIPPF